jgi:hypothetical protein
MFGSGQIVRFFPEQGGQAADFDFSSWPVDEELRKAFAAAFAELTAADRTRGRCQLPMHTLRPANQPHGVPFRNGWGAKWFTVVMGAVGYERL